MPRLLFVLTDQEAEAVVKALAEKITYSTHSEAVEYKNLMVKFESELLKCRKIDDLRKGKG